MTALLWLLAMVPPSALFLIAGIWVVRKKYGGVRHVLGIVAIVVGDGSGRDYPDCAAGNCHNHHG